MRPETLELRGFASFREATTVDFDGVDLFVLAGPTGAGKSSIIDAITFALYGSVPRYDDRRLVAPVISQGQLEARVRLTFTVEARRYAATRVVRRTKTGASTKEARLERLREGVDPEVLAGTADELTSAVESLLGLTFDHFTKTVVLPQGDFQEFLHAKPKDRQDLLVELLDLDVYRQVAQRARRRADAADARVTTLLDQLDRQLAGATEEALVAAKSRVADLERAQALIDEARPELDALVERGKERRRDAEAAAQRATALAAVERPDGAADLADRLKAADETLARATADREAATATREAAEQAAADLPPAAALRTVAQLSGQLPAAEQRIATAIEQRDTTAEARDASARDEEHATAAVEAASERVRQLERQHLAHALTSELAVGEPCPVCHREVVELPPADEGGALDEAREQEQTARRTLQDVQRARRAAEQAATQAAAAVTHAEQQRDDLQQRVDAARAGIEGVDTTDPEAVTAALARVEEAEQALQAARGAERGARQAEADARDARARLDAARAEAWEALDAARLAVAALEPPTLDRDDLGAAWDTLLAWRDERLPAARSEAEAARSAIDEAVGTYRRRADELAREVAELGLEPSKAEVQTLDREVSSALATARGELERVQQGLEEAERTRQAIDDAKRQREVARSLGKHLNARNFEQWLLNRALKRLVVGASGILRDLSSDAYSLDVSGDGAFTVIDHRNADEQRPAKTLSGGETFLASLSLALALAEHVAELAAEGSARLEALFLDEGFGTLDADTLDVVAAAIEELGSRGRMVGLITHVRDLAERVGVRFEVRKTATTSTVERVER
jgi:exonuclease SbcC